MSNQGYSSISPNDEEGRGSSSDPLLANKALRPNWKQSVRKHLKSIIIAFLVAALVGIVLFSSFLPETSLLPRDKSPFSISSGVSDLTMQAGRAKCETIKRTRLENKANEARKNPRAESDQKPILLKNAVVWDGQGNILPNVDIYIENGVIRKVEKGIKLQQDTKVIDVLGHVVSPGLVDMHSHAGVASWPAFRGTDDTNEETSPLTPFVRSIDAFNPSDNAIRIILSGGVTTALVLPGSGNLMGGEAFAFKLRPVSTLSNEDMLVQSNIDTDSDRKWRWMKMACGENPKKVYGRMNQMPSTRLGEAYLFRKELALAQKLMREQDDWCSAAGSSGSRFDSSFPEDLSLESLVALLRGDVLLNIHCYETHDIEAMVRHSLEFNFNISSFHHALDAYRIPSVIKRAPNNITVATFADNWGYKKEAFQGIPQAPKILYDAGIPIALKSDHPVLNSQHLVFEAAKSTHYGLPPQEAFKAVTSNPANAIGLGHRVGSLKVGYDADLVIWDRDPLDLGATPLQVFVDGVPQFDQHPIEPVDQKTRVKSVKKQNVNKVNGTRSFILKNAGYSFLGSSPKEGPLDVIVQDGSMVCSGSDCSHIAGDLPEYDLQGGYVLPGLIGVGSSLGLVELPSEPSTSDGNVLPSQSKDPKDIVFAVDGLKLGTRHLEEAYKGGVLTSITAPISNNVVIGISTAFKTGADSGKFLTDGTIISPAVALHLQIGNEVKSDKFPTISSQVSFIRQLLTESLKKDDHYGRAARGEIPTIISAMNKDEIASLIVLKRDYLPNAKFVILGGTEAHLVAPHLAEANIPVVLRPTLCTPSTFETLHCLSGAPLTNGTLAHVLHSHGVKLGVGIASDGFARNLAWDAGWLSATSTHTIKEGRISEEHAIQLVTSNIRDIYGLGAAVSLNEPEFIVYSGSPFDLQSRLVFIHSENGLEAL